MTGDLAARVRDRACVERPYRLPDGSVLPRHFDEYALAGDPRLLRDVAAGMSTLLPANTTVLVGLELGGVPLVVALSASTGLPTAFVRRTRKDHGTCAQLEGAPVSGERVVLVDDVVRSGTQLVAMTHLLRRAGARVEQATCVLERSLGGRQALAANGVRLRCLFAETDLTPALDAAAQGRA